MSWLQLYLLRVIVLELKVLLQDMSFLLDNIFVDQIFSQEEPTCIHCQLRLGCRSRNHLLFHSIQVFDALSMLYICCMGGLKSLHS